MKLLDKANAARAASNKREFDRGRTLGEEWLLNQQNLDTKDRLREWRGALPTDIEGVCAIAVGYSDSDVAQAFLKAAFGEKPFACRSQCVLGFMSAINNNEARNN